MSLTPPATSRKRMHTRSIRVEAYARDDGYWDLEAVLSDIKDHDFPLLSGLRPAGAPVHEMHLCVTIDLRLTIVAARAQSAAHPYAGYCDAIDADYEKLVGLNLLRGFRAALKERLGGVRGCTHLTELAAVLPTAAVQAFAGSIFRPDLLAAGEHKPFELDSCHALRSDSEAVRLYYPKWHTPSADCSIHHPNDTAGEEQA